MLNFFNISAYSIFTSKKKTFNTIKLKMGLRYPLRNTLVVKGTNQENPSILGAMYFEMM